MDLYLLPPITLGTAVDIAPPCYVTHFMLQGFSPTHKSQEELFHFWFT